MTEENLCFCKNFSKVLLDTPICFEKEYMGIISHPFFSSTMFFDQKEHKFLDLYNKNELKQAKKILTDIIDEINDYIRFFIILNKPYIGYFYVNTRHLLNAKEQAEYLRYVWTSMEFTNNDINVGTNEWLELFKNSVSDYLMEEYELNYLKNLPSNQDIIVYRGHCNKDYLLNKEALSFTLDYETAKFFALRFSRNDKGYIIKYKINKHDILAYFKNPEKEVIINYENIKDYPYEIEEVIFEIKENL